jgi:hypothetical protein
MESRAQRAGIDLDGLDREHLCYVTTAGRRTGRPHTIEIWFAADGGSLFLISGGGDRSDWKSAP